MNSIDMLSIGEVNVKTLIKRNKKLLNLYTWMGLVLKAHFPVIHAKLAYRIAYGKRCNLNNPRTLSEKLLWLSLHTYRNNPLVMELSDKYLVRDFVSERASDKYLNELYYVFKRIEDIRFNNLPNQFSLKISQGCATNLFCKNKDAMGESYFYSVLEEWKTGQGVYDKIMANVGGVSRKQLPKYYICEKYLEDDDGRSPTDYKIYCFNGVPKAILVISDRFDNKTGLFMSTEWEVVGELSKPYKKPDIVYKKPKSLQEMLDVAKQLSEGFPFVRVDMYEIEGKAIFGEMTFFPSGCIKLQETIIDEKTMGELLILPNK